MSDSQNLACSFLPLVLSTGQKERFQNEKTIRRILSKKGTIAVVGISSDLRKPSRFVADYFRERGWKIIPVTPRAGTIFGEPTVPDLISVKEPVDIVDIFRPTSEVAGIVDQAIKIGAKAVWMQLRLIDINAAEKAYAAGLDVVADRCLKVEHERLERSRDAM